MRVLGLGSGVVGVEEWLEDGMQELFQKWEVEGGTRSVDSCEMISRVERKVYSRSTIERKRVLSKITLEMSPRDWLLDSCAVRTLPSGAH